MTEGTPNLKFAGTRDLRLTGQRSTTNSRRRSGLALWALFAVAFCFSVRVHAAVAPNPGGQQVITNSTTSSYVDRDIPVTAAVDNYSTTLVLLLNGAQFYSRTFPNAYADPTVAAAVTAAEGVLSGDGASFGSPVQTANTSVLQGSTTVTSPTAVDTNIATGVATVTTAVTFGPAIILVGENQSQTFTILAGQEDINVNTDVQYYADVYVTTTNTYLVSQTYQISGVTGGAAAVPTPATLAFPGTPRGTTATALTITLTNIGSAPLTGIGLSLGGANPSDFAITTGTNACGSTLAAGSSCSIYVTFTPSSVASFTATLSIADNATGSPQSVPLSGIGTGPQLQFSPGLLNFTAGTPAVPGDTGNGAAAISALVDGGTGMAFDSQGNLYFSDALNNTVRQINTSGNISTFAGTPVSGAGSYAGDSGPAASAALNGPQQIAFDGSGNLYIADMSNNVIRVVNASGTISTFAGTYGTGVCGFAGAYGPVSSAILCNPQGVAVDALGNVYIADTGNNIIRKVDTHGTITLLAGTPTQSGYSGDNQAANKALLSSPTQVATDPAGNVYIADSGNNVIRKVDASGIITTYAGGGPAPVTTTPELATDASIVAVGIATDLGDNLYIASGSSVYVVDSSQDIWLLAGGGSTQVSGVPATQTLLGATAVAVDARGDLFVNDATDYMIYEVGPYGDLVFGSQAGNTTSSAMSVTLTNTGDAAITFSAPTVTGDFAIASGGSCNFGSLAAGASCTVNVTFTPTATGTRTGTISIPTNAPNTPNTVQLSGTGLASTAPDFTITTSTPTMTVAHAGDSATYIATLNAVNNFGGTVAINPTSLPGTMGVQYPASVTIAPGGSQNFNVVIVSSLSLGKGTFPVTITGSTSSGLQYSLTLNIVVQNPALTPTVTVTPASSSITTAQSDLVTVTVNGGSGNPTPTGYVTLMSGTYSSGSVTLSDGSATITIPSGALATALDTLTATYQTDPEGAIYYNNATGSNTVTVTAAPVFVSNVGTALAAQQVAVDITTAGTLNSIQVLTQGVSSLDFTKTSGGTCATTTAYNVGQSCTVNVIFKPQVPGTRPGAVLLTDASNNILGIAYLPGTGIGPEITFNPGVQSVLPSYSGLNAAVPEGVAVDAGLNVYVVDFIYGWVIKYPWTGSAYGAPVQLPFTGLYDPEGVTVDGAGDVFVADFGNSRVVELPWNGSSYGTQVVLADYGFEHAPTPTAVAVDSHGNLFFVVLGHSTIPSALIEMPWTGSGYGSPTTITAAAGLNYPSGLAVDANLNVYIADGGNSQVVEIPWTGTSFGAQITVASGISAAGVAVDGAGDVYITNGGSSQVVEVPWNGTAFGTPVTPSFPLVSGAQLYGIAVDGYGSLYVSSDAYERVVELNVSTPPSLSFANTSVGSVSTDSPQTVTAFNIGNAPLTFSLSTDPIYPTDFPENSSGTSLCASASPLTQGGSCNVSINFKPTTTGSPLSEDVVLTDNNLNVSGAMQSIAMSGTATGTALTAQTITVTTAAPGSAVYNSTFNVAATASSGLPVAIIGSSACSGSGTSTSGSAVTITMTSGTGTCTVTYTQAGNSTYSAAPTVANSTAATPAAQTITVTEAAPASAADNGTFKVAATASSGLPVAISSSGSCSGSGTSTSGSTVTITITSATGSCAVNYSQVGNADYSVAPPTSSSTTATASLTAQTITVTTAAPGSAVYNSTFNVAATASSGLPVAIIGSSACSGSGTSTSGSAVTITMTSGTGTCTVTYTQAGNSTYSAAPTVANSTAATPAAQTITVTEAAPASAADNGTFKVAATASSGLPVAISSSGSCSGSGTSTSGSTVTITITSATGSCAVNYSQVGNADYSVAPPTSSSTTATASLTAQTITVTTAAPGSAVYNSTFNVAATASSGLPVAIIGSSACSGSGTSTSGSAVTITMTSGTGTCTVTYTQAGNSTYSAAPTVANSTAATPAAQTITVTQAAPSSAAYNSTFNVAATASSGLPVSIAGSVACSGSGTSTSGSAVTITMTSGTGTCTVTYTQVGNANYSTAPATANSTAATLAAQTITITEHAPASAAINGTFGVAATASSGLAVAITTSGVCSGSGSGTATITMTASSGTCTVDYNQAGNANYSSAAQASSTTTATAASQTITVTQAAPASAAVNSTFNVAATASSNLPVAITTGGVCSGSGSGSASATITMTAPSGTCTVYYNQAGNATYAAAPQVTSTTAATQVAQTITVTTAAPSTALRGGTFSVAATASSGLPVSIAGSGACSGSGGGSATITATTTGTCTVTYTQAGNTNYAAAATVTSTTSVTNPAPTINNLVPTHTPAGTAMTLVVERHGLRLQLDDEFHRQDGQDGADAQCRERDAADGGDCRVAHPRRRYGDGNSDQSGAGRRHLGGGDADAG